MLRIAEIFQDGMVLQRGKEVCIWGKSDIGNKISVQIQGQKTDTETDREGCWKVVLKPLKESYEETLKVSDGAEQILLQKVAIGDIWIAGGQSNMEFHMIYEEHFENEREECCDPYLRFYDVPKIAYKEQQNQFDYSKFGIWRQATPEDLSYFSAAGYYFAKELRKTQGVPIAIIGCNWGGTQIASWMSRPSLEKAGKNWLQNFERQLEGKDMQAYWEKQSTNAFNNRAGMLDDPFFNFVMPQTVTLEELNAFLGAGNEFTGEYEDIPPEHFPSVLYENMVKKIVPYTIKGVLWYQGESDDTDTSRDIYDRLLTAFIGEWREFWQDSRLPFLIVQLPGFREWIGLPNYNYTTVRRKQQEVAERVPDVWLCSISDAGTEYDVHPKNKKVVGERLALLARGHVYGEDILCDAPVARKGTAECGQITISFRNAGTGLVVQGEQIASLEIKNGGKRIPYSFQIRENEIVLTLQETVVGLISVEFAQGKWYLVNLYNSAGIPAIPFRFELEV